ncbi:undecaprenyldiphospho-muramoylpentapeptide beta-N-acetylglucosaminyltransferase [Thalassoroseus pseudoceratinae]|uniref:undecaprenyldiphospho-muramoylpentapeptide beta-N-acetylglucosaminyltransferase n=1 Tax=Thalassoroseus pseudoceratinae TaxID=2713176 RepID=UPI00141DCFD9|nr:undecaprenyldiphospho-muramoylpentapeptide beta-N-acetylglucosaminyltransferase [Thalassoroseus pseudoceratinae]
MTRRTVLFAGGGTGGHLIPGIAVAEELTRCDPQIRCVFVGSDRPLERDILASAGYEHFSIPVPTPRETVRRPVRSTFQISRSLQLLRRIFRDCTPSAVIGLGGLASGLPIWFGRRHRLPTILLEQNIVAGRMTRLFAGNASAVCTSFPETDFGSNCPRNVVSTGNPLRESITALSGNRINPSNQTLLILGGSQGASAVNDRVLSLLPSLKPQTAGWKIVHQTGALDEQRVRDRYDELGISATVSRFMSDLSKHYANAELAISRAGATTLSELACVGVPAILVPYPTAKDDHQRKNAQFFADAGAAVVMEQNANQTEWIELGQRLLCDSAMRAKMRQAMTSLAKPNATSEVASIIMSVLTPQ